MDCQEVLEFHDDSNRVAQRAKETILLMKKKMLRSHDLIMQYNDTLKECDRLKGDLCIAQEATAKAKWENNLNHTKIIKLESQITECRENEKNFEKKIADQDIKIAGDKCHLEQLICKLQAIESEHSGKLMENEMKKSALEGRIKELEVELKKLKKAQSALENLENCAKPQRRKKIVNAQSIIKETVDIGINTSAENVIFGKSLTADKFTLTDEFYSIKNNPYPIFCHKCEVPMKPSIEKYCRVMTDVPPLMEKLSSPPPRRASMEGSRRGELRDCRATSLDKLTPEVESLKEKIATLERKMKRRKKRIIGESSRPGENCCGHSCSSNYYSPRVSNPANLPTDLMAEFWHRMMNFRNEESRKFNEDRFAGRRERKKSSRVKKRKTKIPAMRKINKSVGSTNWEVESDDCRDTAEKIITAESSDEISCKSRRKSTDFSSTLNRKMCDGDRSSQESNVFLDDGEKLKENMSEEAIFTRQRRISTRIQERSLRNGKSEEKMNISGGELIFAQVNIDAKSTSVTKNTVRSSAINGKTRIARNSESDLNFCEENIAPRIDRSFSCSPRSELGKVREKSADFVENHRNDANALNNFSTLEFDESRTNLSTKDLSNNVEMENHSDEETSLNLSSILPRGNSRKRKRSISPIRRTRKSVKSKLLGKLRALKRNSKTTIAGASNNSTIDDSRIETARNFNESDAEDSTMTSVENHPKKQRIAHVPRKSSSKEREINPETRWTSEKNEFSSPMILGKSENSVGKSQELSTPYKNPMNCVIRLNDTLKRKISENAEISKASSIVDFSSSDPSKSWSPEDRARNSLECKDPSENVEIREKSKNDNAESSSKVNSTESTEIGEIKVASRKMPEVFKVVGNLLSRKGVKTLRTNEPRVATSSRLASSESTEISLPPIFRSTNTTDVSASAKDSSENNVKSGSSRVENSTGDVDFHRESTGEKSNEAKVSSKSDETSVDDESKLSGTSGIIEESPASPDNPTNSCSPKSRLDWTRKIIPNNPSIYENALSSAASTNDHFHSQARFAPEDSSIFDNSQNSIDSPSSFDDFEDLRDNESKYDNNVRKLRTRQTPPSPESNNSSIQRFNEKLKFASYENPNETCDSIDPASYQRRIRSLATLLYRHLAEGKKKNGTKAQNLRKAAAIKLQARAEIKVKEELSKLVESEEWTRDLHDGVIASLRQVSSRRTISKSIVDILIERANIGESLDRKYTPPAPVMTRTQQRIAALINGLESDPGASGVFELVRAGLNFHLFKLGYAIQVEVVEYLIRMLTIMARMKKDRESARMLCCNALYALGRKASNAIYVVMTIWPEVIPMHGTRDDVLVNCLIYLIRTDQSAKATSIKRLLRDYYKYPELQIQSTVLMDSLINALTKEYSGELEVSILLIAKREGTEWAYKNIINGRLSKIIDDNNYPSLLNAFTLLGFLLRTFPVEDENKTIATMVEILCKMLESTEDSPDKEEGIISALLSLGRYVAHFDRIAESILKWKPNRPMRPQTIEQLSSFFKLRSLDWWNKRRRDKINAK